MTTFDTDTTEQDPSELKGIVQKFGGKLALSCYVIQGGEIRVADAIELGRSAALRSQRKTALARERLRRRYRPAHVRILFVGEAPPASGRFFYQADSGLYRGIRAAFVLAGKIAPQADFLDTFRAFGCYLVDLCGTPVDRLSKTSRVRTCRKSEVRLSRLLRQLRLELVVVVVRSIAQNVRRSEKGANWSGRHIELMYPGRWHRHRAAFLRGLIPVLRDLVPPISVGR